ncbi:hypothetical protein QJS10_CPA10g01527 [Acorus calamus]|uniref:Reverse transcriptase zinc-binding domain-containing protein n=1 Tax=Acorus calamus TaxID=4465 RepID=A0AAV9E0X0_ACOCL|nr:hypothetical protein QJS10_CPA10g01527 [Acorus calamus]
MAEENVPHLFLECPLVRLLWRRLKEATGIFDQFDTLDGLWEAGRRLKRRGDQSVMGKISQSFVLAVLWTMWLARTHRIFRNTSIYFENLWESVVYFIKR